MKAFQSFLLAAMFLFFSCHSTKPIIGDGVTNKPVDDHLIQFMFLQMNDVYEITPLEGGKAGGMARVASLRKDLLKQNKNLLTVHAGDFLNPSIIGTIKYDGAKIKGRQMVEVMNASGVDLATFGNHEFDLDEEDLQKRLNESQFEWTTCNTFQVCGDRNYPFYKEVDGRKQFVPETYTWEISDADGTQIKVGIFGVTLPVNKKDYVLYNDFYSSAKKAVEELSATTDVVIGLTHLEIDQDMQLAKRVPNVPLFMGGHDHDNMKHTVGNTVITKADANVKSVYLHTLTHNTLTKETSLKSALIKINDSFQFDPEVQRVVEKWNGILMEKISEIVPNPNRVIYVTQEALDGRESSMRNKQTNLGAIITKSFFLAAKGPIDGAIMNSGSVRIDDQLQGQITSLDIFRALPYGGQIIEVEMTGELLKKVLDTGAAKKGNGAYLQRHKIIPDAGVGWIVNGKPIDTNRKYNIAMNDFLLSGYDLDFFTKENPGVLKITNGEKDNPDDLRRDLRVAITHYLTSKR